MADGDVWVIGDPLDHTRGASTPRPGSSATDRLPFAPKDIAVGGGRYGCPASSTTRSRGSIRRRPRSRAPCRSAPAHPGRGGPRRRVGSEHPRRHGLPGRSGDRRGHGDDRRRRPPRRHRRRDDAVWVAANATPTDGDDSDEVRIGLITICEGAYGLTSSRSVAGAELPLLRRGARPSRARARRTESQERRSQGSRSGSSSAAATRPARPPCRDAAARRAGRRRRPDRPGVHRRGVSQSRSTRASTPTSPSSRRLRRKR